MLGLLRVQSDCELSCLNLPSDFRFQQINRGDNIIRYHEPVSVSTPRAEIVTMSCRYIHKAQGVTGVADDDNVLCLVKKIEDEVVKKAVLVRHARCGP
jgi:hypothetical protein